MIYHWDTGTYTFSSGRTASAPWGVIGLGAVGGDEYDWDAINGTLIHRGQPVVYIGADRPLALTPAVGDDAVTLTPDERRELADEMIRRWQRFRAGATDVEREAERKGR